MLTSKTLKVSTRSTTESSAAALDLATITKFFHAFSSELNLNKLVMSVLQILIENAGAQRGAFIIEKNNRFYLASESSLETETEIMVPIEECKQLPLSMLNYVIRSSKEVVLDNASNSELYKKDVYILKHSPKSVLCFPVLSKGQVISLIYLENNLVAGAFTIERIELLKMLSTQIAISLENSLLYENLEDKVHQRTTEVVAQKEIIEQRNEELNTTLETLREHQRELEKKNHDITASISYAKRIQKALLPQQDDMKKVLGEHFVLLKPRDIVSGDFYWFQQKEDLLLIAAADCTGHGVPGAFMSMIGHARLSQIVNDKEIHELDLILNELHKGIRQAFKQGETESRDGMDIAICSINFKTRQLCYAGAMNPIDYIQQSEQGQPELKEIKPDKRPIGGAQKEEERRFSKHLIDVNKNTTFYIFSDGFQDQLGGEHNKKFMTKNFRELLFNIHHLPMEQQRKILQDTHLQWRGNNKQTDDILVIGVKLTAEFQV